jgi:hypothetical protein
MQKSRSTVLNDQPRINTQLSAWIDHKRFSRFHVVVETNGRMKTSMEEFTLRKQLFIEERPKKPNVTDSTCQLTFFLVHFAIKNFVSYYDSYTTTTTRTIIIIIMYGIYKMHQA